MKHELLPRKIIAMVDTTFFNRIDGLSIIRSYNTKQNLAWEYVTSENMATYRRLRMKIQNQGFEIQAAVIDNKPGLKEVFSDIPVQLCLFHFQKLIRRYLTFNPRLEAARELKTLVSNISFISKEEFKIQFKSWNKKWDEFLKEKTMSHYGSYNYTHKKLRSARNTVKRHLSYLFTYQKYPELKIPTTTNDIESMNSKIKDLLRIHRGYSRKLRNKIITEILSNN